MSHNTIICGPEPALAAIHQDRVLVELTADEQRGVTGGADEYGIPFCGNNGPHPGPWPPNWASLSLAQQVVLPATTAIRM
jgi:hypothetical protein